MVGRCRNFFVTRLLRFWEACNVKKGGELMGIDLVLLDRKVTNTLLFLNFDSYIIWCRILWLKLCFGTVLIQMICCPLSIFFVYDLTMLLLSQVVSTGCHFCCTYGTLSLDSVEVWKCITCYFIFVRSKLWSMALQVAIRFIEKAKLHELQLPAAVRVSRSDMFAIFVNLVSCSPP